MADPSEPLSEQPSPAHAGVQGDAGVWAPACAGEGRIARFTLQPHPDHPPLAVRGVEVEVIWAVDDLLLTYRAFDSEKVIVPEWTRPARQDGLWRTTCFELFLMFDDDERYAEWNFSPSTCWASYAFDGYRDGVRELVQDIEPFSERLSNGLEVDCYTGDLPHGAHRMALSAVIEEVGGVKSYWALAHPPGPPDFHHPACFTARLPAPDAS